MKANHQFLSNWLKRPTSSSCIEIVAVAHRSRVYPRSELECASRLKPTCDGSPQEGRAPQGDGIERSPASRFHVAGTRFSSLASSCRFECLRVDLHRPDRERRDICLIPGVDCPRTSVFAESPGDRARPIQVSRVPELQPPRRPLGQVAARRTRRLPHRQGSGRARDPGGPGAENAAPDLPRPRGLLGRAFADRADDGGARGLGIPGGDLHAELGAQQIRQRGDPPLQGDGPPRSRSPPTRGRMGTARTRPSSRSSPGCSGSASTRSCGAPNARGGSGCGVGWRGSDWLR